MTVPYKNYEVEFAKLMELVPQVVEREHLHALMLEGIEAKSELSEVLGVGEDGRKVFEIGSNDFLLESNLYNLVKRFLEYYGVLAIPDLHEITDDEAPSDRNNFWLSAFLDNNVVLAGKKQGMKLTKAIAKSMTPELKEKWRDYAAGYPSYLTGPPLNWDTAISSIFESLAATKCEVVISTNPLDMILASEQCEFEKSCFQFCGCHANGTLAYIRDSITAFVYIRDKNTTKFPYYKKARAWVYVPPSRRKFLLANFYGSVADAQVRAISDMISTSLAAHAGADNVWRAIMGKRVHAEGHKLYYPKHLIANAGYRGCDDNDNDDIDHETFSHSDRSVWFDRNVMRFAMLKEDLFDDDKPENHLPKLIFKDARCLSCGDTTNHNEKLQCDNCEDGHARIRCHDCGSRTRENDGDYVADDFYCEDCVDDYSFGCNHCGNRFPGSSEHETSAGSPLCNRCHREYYSLCTGCETTRRSDYMHNIEGRGQYCDPCFLRESTRCVECYARVHNDDVIHAHGYGYCEDCVDKHYPECETCEARVPIADMHPVESQFCRACVFANEVGEPALPRTDLDDFLEEHRRMATLSEIISIQFTEQAASLEQQAVRAPRLAHMDALTESSANLPF